jgi:hypothetical protein
MSSGCERWGLGVAEASDRASRGTLERIWLEACSQEWETWLGGQGTQSEAW